MHLLIAHNFYQQPGGEDQVFAAEVELLRRFGHRVSTFEMHNDAVDDMGRASLLAATLWNSRTYRALRERIRAEKPEIVHFHNTFPLISPAAYYAARREGAVVVQTLHNFRLVCANAYLFREGKICENCLGKSAWNGVKHKCYHDSASATAAVATMLTTHRMTGTWKRAVDLYLVPTPSARAKFIQGGLPEEKLFVKPNFIDPDPGVGPGDGGYAVFVSRLSPEKGVRPLLTAWEKLAGSVPLKIVGDGPLAPEVKAACEKIPGVEWLGRRPLGEVCDIIGSAALLVVPSVCYETFGRTAVEAYAKGTPVLASRHGAPADVVVEGRTGWLFNPGDADDLAAHVRRLWSDPAQLAARRADARKEYVEKYTGAANHEQLMQAYRRAMEFAGSRLRARTSDAPPVPVKLPAGAAAR